MGLDAVEIVMDVEDHFGIVVDDDEAGRIRTVGDLVALIRLRVEATSSSPCSSLPAFLSLRRLVRDVVGDDWMRIRPSQSIVDRLSRTSRRQLWRRLPELLGTSPPALRCPQTIRAMQILLSTHLIVAAIEIASIDWAMLPLTLFVAGALILLLHLASSPLRTIPRDDMATLGDLTGIIVGRTTATTDLDLPDDAAILDELRPIVADVLGIDRGKVVLDARLWEDLGAG